MFRKKMSNRKGFTLVELLVVVAIIGILAAIAVPKFANANNSAKVAKIQADLRTIDSASAIYNAKEGAYPTAAQIIDATKGTLTTFPVPPTLVITTAPVYPTATTITAYTINATTGRGEYDGVTADLVKEK